MSIINCQLPLSIVNYQLSIVNYPDSSGISVKNSRGSNSEPETPLQMRHTNSNGEDSLALARVCHPPFGKIPPPGKPGYSLYERETGAGAAAPGDFVCSGCLMRRPICLRHTSAGFGLLHPKHTQQNIPRQFRKRLLIIHCRCPLSIVHYQLSILPLPLHFPLSIINYQLSIE